MATCELIYLLTDNIPLRDVICLFGIENYMNYVKAKDLVTFKTGKLDSNAAEEAGLWVNIKKLN